MMEPMESTYKIVLEVLHNASSQNPEILKPAETQLREWEVQPGFHSILFASIYFFKIFYPYLLFLVCYIKSFFGYQCTMDSSFIYEKWY